MKYILTILISLVIMFPAYSEAASKKQTYQVDNKKPNHKQQKELAKSIKQGKCKEAITISNGNKPKKLYYVCEK